MPFWKCYYHVTWATKNRQSAITPRREEIIFGTIHQVSDELGCTVFAVNGIADHVHVAVAIPPSIAVSLWVQRCKGGSSKMVNEINPGEAHFLWQTGYGLLKFGHKTLPYVVAYIENQKQHHAAQTTEDYLERIE